MMEHNFKGMDNQLATAKESEDHKTGFGFASPLSTPTCRMESTFKIKKTPALDAEQISVMRTSTRLASHVSSIKKKV